jgi:release factor glutamine methyltransferase
LAHQKLVDSPSARFDAEILMAHVLESTRSFLYANPELDLPHKRSETFKKLIKLRAQGRPIAYLTGTCEFWSLPLLINSAVLIPRPDTELLVEAALRRIPEQADWRIADLGTGSGAIALALASERKKCEIHATDISRAAIRVAQKNASRLGLNKLRFHRGSWSEPLPGNGLRAIQTISQLARPTLVDGGWLMFEHGWNQGPATRRIMERSGFINIETLQDLQGHERVTVGEKSQES